MQFVRFRRILLVPVDTGERSFTEPTTAVAAANGTGAPRQALIDYFPGKPPEGELDRGEGDEGGQSFGKALELLGGPPILNGGRVDNDPHWQPFAVDQGVDFAALHLLAGVVPHLAIVTAPLPADLITWLSRTAAEGLASRPIRSRNAICGSAQTVSQTLSRWNLRKMLLTVERGGKLSRGRQRQGQPLRSAARMLVLRDRPPGRASGIIGSSRADSASFRSLG